MEKKVFEQGIFILGRQFPEKVFDAQIMWDFLQDLTNDQYIQAIKEIISSTDEINKAANIIAIIRSKALCNDQKVAGEAWTEVLKQVRDVGYIGCPKFSSEAIRKSVEAIGWRMICLSENPMVERAHFLKIYETIAVREKNRILSDPVKLLVGSITKQLGKIGSN